MEDRVLRLEAAVRELERRLAAIEGVRTLEPDETISDLFAPNVSRAHVSHALAYVGRSFVVLGGAFFLRAITDANIIPHPAGIAAGLVYALAWIGLAHRAAVSDRLNAIFHALVSAVIAYPLIWEATIKFAVFSPVQAALAIAAVTAIATVVALQRGIQTIAWIAEIALLVTSIALVGATTAVMPFALLTIAAGTAALWIGYAFDWTLLRWPIALVANLLVIGLTMRVTRTTAEWPVAVVAVQLLLLNAYVASIAIRTLVRQRNVNVFEMIQTFAAVAVGFGGAVYVAHLTGSGVVPLATVNLLAGSLCYAIAWVFVAKRQGLTRNFYYYTTLAIVLIIVSSWLLLDQSALALTCAALAVVAIVVADRGHLTALRWHAAVYLAVAMITSGAAMAASDALLGTPANAWRPFATPAIVAIAASAVCWWIAPRIVFGALVLWTLGGWIVATAVPPLCGVPGAGANAGGIATVRTIVIAAAALAGAWIAKQPKFKDVGWLVYALLAVGAVKLLAEDLPQSQPATLFIALACYGGALIAASRH